MSPRPLSPETKQFLYSIGFYDTPVHLEKGNERLYCQLRRFLSGKRRRLTNERDDYDSDYEPDSGIHDEFLGADRRRARQIAKDAAQYYSL